MADHRTEHVVARVRVGNREAGKALLRDDGRYEVRVEHPRVGRSPVSVMVGDWPDADKAMNDLVDAAEKARGKLRDAVDKFDKTVASYEES